MFCSKCGANIAENSAFCPACGNPVQQATQPQQQAQPSQHVPAEPQGPKGWGGWMTFVQIFMVLAAVGNIFCFVNVVGGLNLSNFLDILYLFYIALTGFVFYLFCTKSRKFPSIFVVWMIFGIIVVVVFLMQLDKVRFIMSREAQKTVETVLGIFGGAHFWGSVIFIPYVLNSKRVKNTFIH